MPGGEQGGVDVAPLMRGRGWCPPRSLSCALSGHLRLGGVRVAVGADGRQAARSGAVAAYGAAGPGERGWARAWTPPGWTPLILR
jgi:hypothetical protein